VNEVIDFEFHVSAPLLLNICYGRKCVVPTDCGAPKLPLKAVKSLSGRSLQWDVRAFMDWSGLSKPESRRRTEPLMQAETRARESLEEITDLALEFGRLSMEAGASARRVRTSQKE
jgi:hypothetical protein